MEIRGLRFESVGGDGVISKLAYLSMPPLASLALRWFRSLCPCNAMRAVVTLEFPRLKPYIR